MNFFFSLDTDYVLSIGCKYAFHILLERRTGLNDEWKTIICYPRDLDT